MGKLRLEVEDLRVESFSTEHTGAQRGTVRGRDGTDYTVCWGLCGGGETQCDLSCGPESEACTHNPDDLRCYSYAVQCPPTQHPNGTCVDTCVNAAGDTICGNYCTY